MTADAAESSKLIGELPIREFAFENSVMWSLTDVKIPGVHAFLRLPSVSPTAAQPSSSLDFALVKTLEREPGVCL